MRTVRSLPLLSTVPRSGTWFLRFAVSFLCHLQRGGRITDRLSGRAYGDPKGPLFDFARFVGGPLFHVQGVLPDRYLFIGHAMHPGFTGTAAEFPWWRDTSFHVRGYDYFGDGWNYERVPAELVPWSPVRQLRRSWNHGVDCVQVDVPAVARAAVEEPGSRVVFVYRDPLEQAESYFWYCRTHKDPSYRQQGGRALENMSFEEYLLKFALVSYARQFVSFQEMARRCPGRVMMLSYDELMASPTHLLGAILDHLEGGTRTRPQLAVAVHLARPQHLKEIELELGRSLDGNGEGRGHMRPDDRRVAGTDIGLRSLAISRLAAMGVLTELLSVSRAEGSVRDDARRGSLLAGSSVSEFCRC